MFLDFTIKNFRSIKEAQTLSFEATKENHLEDYFVVRKDKYRILKYGSILGPNASGKSNVLKGFLLLRSLVLSPCENKTDEIEYASFALDRDWANRDSRIETNFICHEKKYRYEVTFNHKMVRHESLRCTPFGKGAKEHLVFDRESNAETLVSIIKWGERYSAPDNRRLMLNVLTNRTVLGAFQKSNVDIPWLKELTDWFNEYLLPPISTSRQGLYEYTAKKIYKDEKSRMQVEELLHRADMGVAALNVQIEQTPLPEVLIKTVLSESDAPEDLKKKLREDPTSTEYKVCLTHAGCQNAVPFKFDEESSGTKRLFELSGVLIELISHPHFVVIDELENKLHPDLYTHFINLFLLNAGESQLLFTTHQREFLNDKESFRDDCVWLTEKGAAGDTTLFSLADFDSSVLRNSTNRLNALTSGRLGGIPNLGSPYVSKL